MYSASDHANRLGVVKVGQRVSTPDLRHCRSPRPGANPVRGKEMGAPASAQAVMLIHLSGPGFRYSDGGWLGLGISIHDNGSRDGFKQRT